MSYSEERRNELMDRFTHNWIRAVKGGTALTIYGRWITVVGTEYQYRVFITEYYTDYPQS